MGIPQEDYHNRTIHIRLIGMVMFIRSYHRASTKEQDAKRAKAELVQFAKEHDQKISSFYVENESGATLVRPQLMQLIDDTHEDDIILVEQIDCLARLNPADWDTLKQMLSEKKLSVVSNLIWRFNLRAALSLRAVCCKPSMPCCWIC